MRAAPTGRLHLFCSQHRCEERKQQTPVHFIRSSITLVDMRPDEENLMKAITNGTSAEVEAQLRTGQLNLNFTDENGITPLQNACYKGRHDVAKLLIERGGDVNSQKHVHGYTSLMFAALGGHVRVVSLLLEQGADPSVRNSVNRTAAQMAAFVGQHKTANVINNFVPREEVECFTKASGLEKEPKLPSHLLQPLLIFIRRVNVNPVRVAMELTASNVLLENHHKVVKVLDLLCEREMAKEEPNEPLAMKYHHLSFLMKHIANAYENSGDQENKLQTLCKMWLKGDENGFPTVLENLLRQSIKEFPFRDSAIFLQLVKTLYNVPVGSEPSAVTILAQSINGQKGFDDDAPVCSTCGECGPPKKCSQCKSVQYCDQDCQKMHWFTHKKICPKLKQEREDECKSQTGSQST